MTSVKNVGLTTLTAAVCACLILSGCGAGGASTIGLNNALVAAADSNGTGMGGPGMMMGLFARLNLTGDQKTQARAIFQSERTDIQALREQAHTDIRNLLTPDQQAIFDTLPQPHGPGMGPPAGMGPMMGMGGGMGPPEGVPGPGMGMGMGPRMGGMYGPGMDGEDAGSMCGMGGPLPGAGGTPPDEATMRQHMVDRLATILTLTDDQKAQVLTILTNLDTAVDARRQQAETDFRAILTADQIAILDQIEAEHHGPQP